MGWNYIFTAANKDGYTCTRRWHSFVSMPARSLNTRADGPPHPQSYRYDVGAGLIYKVLIFSATCQYIGLNVFLGDSLIR